MVAARLGDSLFPSSLQFHPQRAVRKNDVQAGNITQVEHTMATEEPLRLEATRPPYIHVRQATASILNALHFLERFPTSFS
jgi:hypothetical protein